MASEQAGMNRFIYPEFSGGNRVIEGIVAERLS